MNMKMMIVDDHAGVRNLIRQLLSAPGDRFLECTTGVDAVQAARDFKPDYVTMDIRLPDLSGLEAARAIRAIHPTCRIVIVTSYDQEFLRQSARQVGAIAYVLKENLTELRSVLFRGAIPPPQWSSDGRPEPESAGTSDPAKPVSPDGSSTVPTEPSYEGAQGPTTAGGNTRLRVLMVDDSENDCVLIRRQLRRCGFEALVKRVDNHAEMRRALEQDRWDIVFADCKLPMFSGPEALGLIKEMGLNIPTLCVTGSQDPEKIAELLNAGACALIDKNDLAPLCSVVARVLNWRVEQSDPSGTSTSEDTAVE